MAKKAERALKPAGVKKPKKVATVATPPAEAPAEASQPQPAPAEKSAAPKLKGLKKAQVLKAAAALLAHLAKQRAASANLLEEDEFIYLTLALTRFPERPRKDKPIRLSIPHPVLQFEGAEVCLFVKDHKGEGHKAAKARLRQQQIAGVSKVVGLSKLRTKYEAPEAKRALCSQFDVFLADDRILPSLPKAIGKSFFAKKKQPLPVDLRRGDWSAQVRKATEATYMYQPSGNSLGIRVARSSFSPEQVQANVLAALTQAVAHTPDGWPGIRAAFLKSSDSVALPIFQRTPEVTAEPAADPAAA